MTDRSRQTQAHVAAMAETLGLTLLPEWQDGVYRFFETARGMADLVAAAGVSETAEPAPIFTPQGIAASGGAEEPRS